MPKFIFMSAKIFIPILSILFFTSCMTNTEDLTGSDTINPEVVSYSGDVQPIFNQTCGGSGCHIQSSQNNVNLSSYSSTISSIGTNYGENIVVPGLPDSSPLVDKIEANPELGSRMPLTGGYLTPEEIQIIRTWISNGAEDN